MATNPQLLLHLILCIIMGINRMSGFPHRSYFKNNSYFQNDSDYIPTHLKDVIRVSRADYKIVFPSDDNDDDSLHNVPAPNPICSNSTFCEEAKNYPSEIVEVALRAHKDLRLFSGVQLETEVLTRFNFSPEDVSLCESYEKIVYPKVAQNKDQEWLFVVNQGDFKQSVRIEICGKENNECNLIDGFAEGYKTICKQKYIYRQLVSVSSTGKIKSDLFRFPSSCCCHIKFTGDPLLRMGVSKKSELPSSNNKKIMES